MSVIKLADRVPPLSALDSNGDLVSTNNLRGKTTVLFFYPKDGSPICTKEACVFRDATSPDKVAGRSSQPESETVFLASCS